MLAEQHAVAGVDQQADTPGDAQADQARLAHAPEGEDQRDEVGREAQVFPRQEVEQQRDRERGRDGADPGRPQDVLRLAAKRHQPSFSFARARRAFSERRSLLDWASSGRGGRAVSSDSTRTNRPRSTPAAGRQITRAKLFSVSRSILTTVATGSPG